MTEREEKLLIAAKEILNDFDRYGKVLQTGDNGEYGMESSIGMLNTAILQYIRPPDPQHGREPEPKPLAQYLAEYLARGIDRTHEAGMPVDFSKEGLKLVLDPAFDAYESTENVLITIIKKKVR